MDWKSIFSPERVEILYRGEEKKHAALGGAVCFWLIIFRAVLPEVLFSSAEYPAVPGSL